MGRPKVAEKRSAVFAYLPKREVEQLDQLAKQRGLSRSQLVGKAVREFLNVSELGAPGERS